MFRLEHGFCQARCLLRLLRRSPHEAACSETAFFQRAALHEKNDIPAPPFASLFLPLGNNRLSRSACSRGLSPAARPGGGNPPSGSGGMEGGGHVRAGWRSPAVGCWGEERMKLSPASRGNPKECCKTPSNWRLFPGGPGESAMKNRPPPQKPPPCPRFFPPGPGRVLDRRRRRIVSSFRPVRGAFHPSRSRRLLPAGRRTTD